MLLFEQERGHVVEHHPRLEERRRVDLADPVACQNRSPRLDDGPAACEPWTACPRTRSVGRRSRDGLLPAVRFYMRSSPSRWHAPRTGRTSIAAMIGAADWDRFVASTPGSSF